MRRIVHHIQGRESDPEQDDETQHRGEKRVQFARRRNLGARMDVRIVGLRTHECLLLSPGLGVLPGRLVWARSALDIIKRYACTRRAQTDFSRRLAGRPQCSKSTRSKAVKMMLLLSFKLSDDQYALNKSDWVLSTTRRR